MSSKIIILCLGIVLGIALPFAIDYVFFGSVTPCRTYERFEDGSSIQHCEVRR